MKKTMGKVLSILIVMSMLLSTMAFMSFATAFYDSLVVGSVGTVNITEENGGVTLEFTPTEAGYYVISSDNGGDDNNIDPCVYVYDSNDNYIASDDDSGEGLNFKCFFNAEAGETYLIQFTTYSDSNVEYDYLVEVVETPVSIEAVPSRDLIENFDGYFTIGEYYDEELGEWVSTEEYFYYDDNIFEYTVTYKDGTVYTGDRSAIYNETGYWIEVNSNQSYDNQWGIGTHTVEIEMLGVTGSCTVTVVENPVESIEAVPTKDLIENWSGYYTTGEYWDNELGVWVETEEYFYYDDVYDGDFFEYIITYKDGNVYTGDYWDIEEATGYTPSISYNQGYENQWGIGSHDVEISFLGNAITVPVNVIECPVESITVTQGNDLIEGVHGDYITDSLYDEYDEYIGESDTYFYYYANEADLEYTVTYKDGTIITGNTWKIQEETGENIDLNSDQSYDNPFDIGYNDITVSFLGFETTAQVKVVESPLDYVVMNDITIIKNADGYWESDGYYDELGEWVYTDEYFYYHFNPSYTAVMQDGTEYKSDSDGDIKYADRWVSFYYNDDQSFENSWDVGEHEVTGYFMGQEVSFTVEVVETPVENVTLTPVRNLIFGIDEEYYYFEYIDFIAEIKFKDGSTDECLVSDLYREYGYELTFNEPEFISDYVSAGTFSFMGYDGEFEVTFIDNPYESITISGLNELVISLNKADGTSDIATVIGCDWRAGDLGSAYGYIETDKGAYPSGMTFAFDEANEEEYVNKDITVYIGDMESNTLETNNWYWALQTSKGYYWDVEAYTDYCKWYYGREFTGLDITTSNYNVTDLVNLAVLNLGWNYDCEYYEEDLGDNSYSYAIYSVEDIAEMVEMTFNISDVDYTKHVGYNGADNTIKTPSYYNGYDAGASPEIDYTIEYINGKWYGTRSAMWWFDEQINIVLNDEMLLERITFGAGNRQGWVLEDGKWAYYENGIKVTNKWILDSVGWCYVGGDGYCVTNAWKADSKGWCYLDASGRMVYNNWVYDGGKWYFIDANGYMVSNCWKKDSKGWCYLGSSGAMLTNAWVMDSVGWCYVGADGYCVTNKWVKDSKGWCYLDANGRMATNKWIKDSVGWCYVGADGYCLTNAWVKDSVGWCYLDANGRMTISKWVQDGGKWYYLDANGYMVTGTKVINGKTYKFASNGVWIG